VRVLVVDDEPKVVDVLRRALEREGYAVDTASGGEEALWAASEHEYAVVVLDAMIPPPDGFEVCRRLRAAGDWVPVLMLTARDAVRDRVAGLDSGADDYLTKPFALDELHARVRSLVRRAPNERPVVIEVGDLRLDPTTRAVTRDGRPIELTAKAFAVLEYLMRNAGKVVSRSELLEHVWDFAFDGSSNIVDAYVSRVREVVDRPFSTPMIETVRGAGYRLNADTAHASDARPTDARPADARPADARPTDAAP
jgi:two-component system OmpR family response regulator